jgi:hypothetical protein
LIPGWTNAHGLTDDQAAHPIEAERYTLLNGYGDLCAVTGIAIAHTEAEWEALTAHAETQKHLLELIALIFAMPIGRARWDRSFAQAGFLLIGHIQANRCRILMKPRGREGIDLQGVECDRPKHTVEMYGKQRIEDLPQAVIMERGTCEAGLEQG